MPQDQGNHSPLQGACLQLGEFTGWWHVRREREGVLASAGPLLVRGALLPAGLLETTRMRDANIAEPSRAVVRSVEFHPDGQVLMTAGLDKRLRFFQVCAERTDTNADERLAAKA